MPLNSGNTINIRRFESLAANTTALTEGVTPAGKGLTVTVITAAVLQYGDFIQVSDNFELMAMDPVLTESAELLGEQSGNSLDQVCRDGIMTGTAAQYAAGAAGRANVLATMSISEIRKGVRTLNVNNAKPFGDGNYVAIASPRVIYDIQGDSAWVNAQIYAGSGNIFEGEVGKMYGVRFLMTSNAKAFTGAGSGGGDVLATLLFGVDAYAVIDLEGVGAVRSIIKPLGSAGTSDPLNQIATSGR